MQTSTKLREFLLRQREALLRLLRHVPWKDLPWLPLGYVVMLVVCAMESDPPRPESEDRSPLSEPFVHHTESEMEDTARCEWLGVDSEEERQDVVSW